MKIIARIKSDFPKKFGIPRQSGLSPCEATVIFEPEYRCDEALRGLEDYSHLWLLWEFSQSKCDGWSPTVRPPRLGGNKRMGVFATRSPYRPNPIGLSCVELISIEKTAKHGTVLRVQGADLMNGTPIYDIKPYLPFTDSHPEAQGGFADDKKDYHLSVECPNELLGRMPEGKRDSLISVLSQDPRPQYIEDENRIFGFEYSGCEIKFRVSGDILTVTDITRLKQTE